MSLTDSVTFIDDTEVITRKTADGWDVHVKHADDVVVRTIGKRITVAVIPDDDDAVPTPLDVTLGTP